MRNLKNLFDIFQNHQLLTAVFVLVVLLIAVFTESSMRTVDTGVTLGIAVLVVGELYLNKDRTSKK